VNQLHTVEGLAGGESIWNPGDSQNAWLVGENPSGVARTHWNLTGDGVSEFELLKNYFRHGRFRH